MSGEFYRRHFIGSGGIKALIPIAVPMILTCMFDTLMSFVDRMYLSYVGKQHIAACTVGGSTSWTCMTLFVGLISYSSAIIAHYYGARRFKECPRVVYQALVVALASYPLILLSGIVAARTLGGEGHDAYQVELECRYFWYMLFGGILSLSRCAFSSFFAGIGKTRIVMIANAVALVVNLISNYVLIFGKLGFPALGIDGAAIGTLLASLSMVLVVGTAFWVVSAREPFRGRCAFKPGGENLKMLLRYGLPTGIENFLGMASFLITLSALNGYGADVAAATSIVFIWDNLSFCPLTGLQVGVTALVGQNMGAGNPGEAERSAYSGYKIGFCYSGMMVLFLCLIPGILAGLFTPDVAGVDYAHVRELAVPMIRMASLYLLFDCLYLISSGALRGAGDTVWVMIAGVLIHWFIAGTVWCMAKYLQVSPIAAWGGFVGSLMFGGLIMLMRFKQGRWKLIKMLKDAMPPESAG